MHETYGEVARVNFPRKITLFFHPDDIRYFLKDNAKNYRKSDLLVEMTPVLGQGLLTSGGELWKSQRRIVAPEFQFLNLKKFCGMMVAAAEELFQSWHVSAKNREARNLVPDMMWLTFKIAGESMFGSKVESSSAEVAHALTVAMEGAIGRMRSIIRFPKRFPTPGNKKNQRAVATLNRLVDNIIEQRKKQPRSEMDLLSRLFEAKDPETGKSMAPSLIRDEVMTLLLAGHETTSNALSWTLYLLGKNPEAARRLQAEVDSVLNGRSPEYDDLVKLAYTKRVFQESMRLYPPAAAVSRNALAEDNIGGVYIPANGLVECSQWVTHRRADFWTEPLHFDPDRFLPERISKQHPFAYFPFGAGPRECVGKNFAMIEGPLLLALMAQRFVITLVPNLPVEPEPLITVRPKQLMVNFTAR